MNRRSEWRTSTKARDGDCSFGLTWLELRYWLDWEIVQQWRHSNSRSQTSTWGAYTRQGCATNKNIRRGASGQTAQSNWSDKQPHQGRRKDSIDPTQGPLVLLYALAWDRWSWAGRVLPPLGFTEWSGYPCYFKKRLTWKRSRCPYSKRPSNNSCSNSNKFKMQSLLMRNFPADRIEKAEKEYAEQRQKLLELQEPRIHGSWWWWSSRTPMTWWIILIACA